MKNSSATMKVFSIDKPGNCGSITLVIIASLIVICNSAENQTENGNDSEVDVLEQLVVPLNKTDTAIKELIRRIPELGTVIRTLRHLFPKHDHNKTTITPTTPCNTDLVNLGFSLTDKWAFPLIDSYGKPPSGLLKGDIVWTGNYDQCRSFQAPKTRLFPNGFKGRYCFLYIKVGKSDTAIQTAICVPHSCNTKDLNDDNSAIINFLNKIPIVRNYVKKLPQISFYCLPEDVPLSTAAIICAVVIGLAFALTLLGTSYDLYSRYYKSVNSLPINFTSTQSIENTEESTAEVETTANGVAIKPEKTTNQEVENDTATLVQIPHQRNRVGEFLLCFSALLNGEAILDTSDRPGQLTCLHGIRFISITWVILGHTYVFGMGQIGNMLDMLEAFNTWSFQAISNATFSVDTFFLLSGFLLTYIFLKDRSKFTVGKLPTFYLHRFIRLTPVYMMVVFAYGTLFNFIGDGPYWHYQDQHSNLCTKNWWKNLLYINNFFSVTEMCIGWSWYLSNDMQFFLISPIFLVLLKSPRRRHRYVGLGVILGLLASSWIATLTITVVENLPIMFEGMGNANDPKEAEDAQYSEFDKIYDKPWTRIGPYLIGCLLGALYMELKGAQKFLSMKLQIIIWSGAIALSLTDVYGLYNAHISLTMSAFYNSLARSAWSLTVAWVIFACLTGHGGPVNKFLSWKLWFPLSRLTYCAYLTHPLVMYFYYQTLRRPVYVSGTFVAVHYLGFTILTYALAFVTTLLFEAPVIKLEKFIKGTSTSQ